MKHQLQHAESKSFAQIKNHFALSLGLGVLDAALVALATLQFVLFGN